MRLWGLVREWIGLTSMDNQGWATTTIHDWWAIMTSRKDLASLTLLTSWEIWNERNARVFRNKHAPPLVLFTMIKYEAKLWVIAGAKCMSNFIPGD
jgi:hypothetical protein